MDLPVCIGPPINAGFIAGDCLSRRSNAGGCALRFGKGGICHWYGKRTWLYCGYRYGFLLLLLLFLFWLWAIGFGAWVLATGAREVRPARAHLSA